MLASRVLAGCSLASAGCHTEEHANGSQRRSPTLRSMWPAPTSSSRAMDDRTELPEESDTAITTFPEVRSASSTETTEVSLSIAGMTCGACAARVERQLNKIDGVVATVNLATERAQTVRAPRGQSPSQGLVKAVEAAGYGAEPVRDLGNLYEEQRRGAGPAGALAWATTHRFRPSFMPLCDLSSPSRWCPSPVPRWQWLLIAVASPVLTWAAWPFYRTAVRNARHHTSTMDTLVSLGIVAATSWSLYAMFWRDTVRSQRWSWWPTSRGEPSTLTSPPASPHSSWPVATSRPVRRRPERAAVTGRSGG